MNVITEADCMFHVITGKTQPVSYFNLYSLHKYRYRDIEKSKKVPKKTPVKYAINAVLTFPVPFQSQAS